MILNRFFKPKWQHANPEIRKQAVQELAADDPVLQQLAHEDPDPGLRRTALERLTDLKLLQRSASGDADAVVRTCAHTRLQALLNGAEPISLPLAKRMTCLAELTEPKLLEALARTGIEPELRIKALIMLNQEALYAECAIDDNTAQVRAAAVKHVQDLALLERIAKETRNRDKRVSRLARERVEAARAEQRRQQELEELCQTLENLSWDGETGPNAARFAKLEEVWRKMAVTDELWVQRFGQARERFAEHFQASVARRQTQTELCRQMQQRLNSLEQMQQLDPEEDKELDTWLQQQHNEWASITASKVSDIESRRQIREFEQLCAALQTRRQQLYQNFRQSARMRQSLTQAQQLLESTGQVLESEVMEIEQRWRGLSKPDSLLLQTEMQQQFDRIVERLRQRLRRQVECKADELAAIESCLGELEQALEDGELQQAIEIDQRVRQLLESNISLNRQQMEQQRQRLQSCGATIAKLRGWRRWGTNQAREHLIDEIEGLSDQALAVTDRAQQIQAARTVWKEMDTTAGPAPRPLWKRFDEVCERAYEPCRVYFQAQAEERQHNLHKRQTLCAELERFASETDWSSSVDWRQVSRFVQNMQQQWHRLGAVNRADRRTIERRYRKALEALQQRLKPQIEQDVNRRRALIERVQQLAESEDIRAAIDEVKRLQAEWKPHVLATHRREQSLWKQFRAACDAVFARRQAAQETLDAERHSNLAKRKELTAAVIELAQQQSETVLASWPQYREYCHQWEAVDIVPRASQRDNERDFAAACKTYERSYRHHQFVQNRSTMAVLARRAELCKALEALVTTEPPPEETAAELARAEASWSSLTAATDIDITPLQVRFERVCEALQRDGEARQTLGRILQHEQQQKRQLCLQLEIAAGVDTPEAFSQERMEYQVARLSRSLGDRSLPGTGSEKSAQQDTLALEQQWYATGDLADPIGQVLDQRFHTAIAAWVAANSQ